MPEITEHSDAQTELLPKTALDLAMDILSDLQGDVLRRQLAITRAMRKLEARRLLVEAQEAVVRRLSESYEQEGPDDDLARDVLREMEESTAAFAADPDDQAIPDGVRDALLAMKQTGEAEATGVAMKFGNGPWRTIAEKPLAADPTTGEVLPDQDEDDEDAVAAAADQDAHEIAAAADQDAHEIAVEAGCSDDCSLEDPYDGHVLVIYPDASGPVCTEVGPFTRYAELIYDYLIEHDPQGYEADYVVVDQAGKLCGSAALIPSVLYGRTFSVVRREELTL